MSERDGDDKRVRVPGLLASRFAGMSSLPELCSWFLIMVCPVTIWLLGGGPGFLRNPNSRGIQILAWISEEKIFSHTGDQKGQKKTRMVKSEKMLRRRKKTGRKYTEMLTVGGPGRMLSEPSFRCSCVPDLPTFLQEASI